MSHVFERYKQSTPLHILIFCFIALVGVMGCGSKDTSAGVAQLDKVKQETLINPSNQTAAPTVNTPGNTPIPSSTATNVQDQTDEEIATAFTECLRMEGFDVSDPELNADGTVNMRTLRQNLANNPKFNFQDPRTRESMQKCVPVLQNASFAGQPSQEDEIELQDNLLQIAECLRDAGIDVKDPDFSAGRGQAFRSMLDGVNFDQDSLRENMSQCSETIFGNEDGAPPVRGGPQRREGRPPGR